MRKRPCHWVAVYTEQRSYGYPSTLIMAPTTYTAAREAAINYINTLPTDHRMIAKRDRTGAEKLSSASEAFPVTEEATKEWFLLMIPTLNKDIFVIPSNSYMFSNCNYLWTPKERDDEDDDYDEEDHYGYYGEDEEEPAWKRNCTCDASGPYFCSCRRSDD
jgi:hypothetical protein